MAESWQTKAAAKRTAQLSKIPKEWLLSPEYLDGVDETSPNSVLDMPAKCGILCQEELSITNLDATSLAKAVSSGSIKSSSVATAFCKRAAIAQQLANCLTEIFFDDAIKRGEALDAYMTEHGKPMGPLHGVPVSIKDSFKYKGTQSTLGIVSFLDKEPDDENSPLVDILLDLGAVLYCKTNIPTTLMTADSHNNVFGRVLNPHKLSLGAGGSSGGEGALVALRGSVIGIGTDIGGSIRIPALCNGTYGFKPTPGRIPYGNQAWCSARGSPGFPACAGPLTNSFSDIAFFFQTILSETTAGWDRDSSAIFYPWRSSIASSIHTKPLRIGYYIEDPAFPIHPPVRRALDSAAKALAAAGHEVIVLKDPPSMKTAIDLSTSYWSMDNSKLWLKNIEASGEPIIPSLQKTIKDIFGRKPEGYTLSDLFEINTLVSAYKPLWNDLWVANKLDIILCPGAQTTAVPHDEYGLAHYTTLWNLMQWPGVMIPTGGFADREVDKDERAEIGGRRYDVEEVHGAPLSIQLVTRAMQDEELVCYGRVIDEVLKAA